ncbi:hypothetical protein PM082_003410 [Marasmius tenuissimus]|nr:hypothetical protein PM082_003410 [Marasmius tenuissimus]
MSYATLTDSCPEHDKISPSLDNRCTTFGHVVKFLPSDPLHRSWALVDHWVPFFWVAVAVELAHYLTPPLATNPPFQIEGQQRLLLYPVLRNPTPYVVSIARWLPQTWVGGVCCSTCFPKHLGPINYISDASPSPLHLSPVPELGC